ncbi:hypothetical protein CVCC1112_3857 [Paenarthrobacter nicotinovorans]|nr:hypothetical protein CVCC1112_3857 [Paenarthrobacter nicotinovorans]
MQSTQAAAWYQSSGNNLAAIPVLRDGTLALRHGSTTGGPCSRQPGAVYSSLTAAHRTEVLWRAPSRASSIRRGCPPSIAFQRPRRCPIWCSGSGSPNGISSPAGPPGST